MSSLAAHRRIVCVLAALAVMTTGCSTMVAYKPQPVGDAQTLRYTQGVGTLTVKDSDQEVFMYPTYRAQGTELPTFTIGYANNGADDIDFSPDNIKAYFRGVPVPIYTYTDRVAEIRAHKQAQQIALAIVGGLAAGAAAYGASRRTYTSSHSGFVRTRSGGFASFAGTSTTRVYDPAAGILAGAAVGGATALGVRQLEYNAQAQEEAAGSMLQANTVAPLQMVAGDVIVKDCCDHFVKPEDAVRFEVSARGKTYVFNFAREKASK